MPRTCQSKRNSIRVASLSLVSFCHLPVLRNGRLTSYINIYHLFSHTHTHTHTHTHISIFQNDNSDYSDYQIKIVTNSDYVNSESDNNGNDNNSEQ